MSEGASGVKTLAKSNMRFINQISTPERSRPGLPTTASSTVGQQGTGGNCGTVGQRRRRREGRHLQRQERRKGRSVEGRVKTLNVVTMLKVKGWSWQI